MKKQTISIILHIIAWLLLLAFPLIISSRLMMGKYFLLIYYTLAVINILIFYTNYLILVPRLFFQKKKYKYILSVLALMIFFYYINEISGRQILSYIREERKERFEMARDEGLRPGPPIAPGMIRRIMDGVPRYAAYFSSASFMIFLSLGLKVLERQSEIEKKQEETEKAKLNAELALLKNQVSPHFFLNTLNNIYSLSTSNPEDSRTAILKLSKMMRYLLYDSEDGDTKLSDEIELMTNYIDLMKLRLDENYNLRVKFPAGYRDFRIPPLLFIPFIENAFKHGVSFREDSFIDIFMETTNNLLIFRTFNSISPAGAGTGLESSGIGLNNVRKRLDLLFPGKHDLQLNKTEKTFEVLLKIQVTT
jgi:hypothetical protein